MSSSREAQLSANFAQAYKRHTPPLVARRCRRWTLPAGRSARSGAVCIPASRPRSERGSRRPRVWACSRRTAPNLAPRRPRRPARAGDPHPSASAPAAWQGESPGDRDRAPHRYGPRFAGTSRRADEGTRTLDLLHGKQFAPSRHAATSPCISQGLSGIWACGAATECPLVPLVSTGFS